MKFGGAKLALLDVMKKLRRRDSRKSGYDVRNFGCHAERIWRVKK